MTARELPIVSALAFRFGARSLVLSAPFEASDSVEQVLCCSDCRQPSTRSLEGARHWTLARRGSSVVVLCHECQENQSP